MLEPHTFIRASAHAVDAMARALLAFSAAVPPATNGTLDPPAHSMPTPWQGSLEGGMVPTHHFHAPSAARDAGHTPSRVCSTARPERHGWSAHGRTPTALPAPALQRGAHLKRAPQRGAQPRASPAALAPRPGPQVMQTRLGCCAACWTRRQPRRRMRAPPGCRWPGWRRPRCSAQTCAPRKAEAATLTTQY